MVETKSKMKTVQGWAENRAIAVWINLQTNHLWQRMLKNTLATTITVILATIPAILQVYGRAAYLAPMTTVFGHPGRNFGAMAESLVLTIAGTLLGTAWSILGIYLSSLIFDTNTSAAYTIRSIFMVISLLFHGFIRSYSPRLFLFVLLMVIVCVVTLTGTSIAVSAALVTTILYPILTAVGVLLIVNVCVFPEFSSSLLGITTLETLHETISAIRDAGTYFTSIAEGQTPKEEAIEPENEENGLDHAPTAEELAEMKKVERNVSFVYKILLKMGVHKKDGKDGILTKEKEKHIKAHPVKLSSLSDSKAKLRVKLATCRSAQQECIFELAFSVLPPRDLKPVSETAMKKLVANTIALIGACESKYALMGDDDDNDDVDENAEKHTATPSDENAESPARKSSIEPGSASSSYPDSPVDESSASEMDREKGKRKMEKRRKKKKKRKSRLERETHEMELIKPRKEIEFGDTELLKYLVNRIAKPLSEMQEKIDMSVDVVTSCLAFCFDVPKLPSGARPPKGVRLEEIDIRVEILVSAIDEFDRDSAAALESAASLHDLEGPQVDIMPRMETFLISSFLLNLRQAALHTLEMLRHCRTLVDKRQKRQNRRRLYAPRINWKKWLTSGGEQDMLALPEQARKDVRTGTKETSDEDVKPDRSEESLLMKRKTDEESAGEFKHPRSPSPPPRKKIGAKQAAKVHKKPRSPLGLIRHTVADSIEYTIASEHVLYAIKLTAAVVLVTFPAFISAWNSWYSDNRGLWAALQLVLITEVSLGTSIRVFVLRAIGTSIGCVWGYAAYEAGNGNRVICVILLVIGIIPSTYIQLGSKYIKAGMVSIISMCIVALANYDATTSATATTHFLQRIFAFWIGGMVALVVEVVLFPVRARELLVESLAASIEQITEMEACLAFGIESEINVDAHSSEVSSRFETAKIKAQAALTAAETFLSFTAHEPRLKGSFSGLGLVYTEVLYVLHQVVDKMDNMLQLRKEYGSGVLEELNAQVFPYRRNVAGSITLVLFAIHEALTTKLPLPQFLPSARLAHLRMVNRVREVVLNTDGAGKGDESDHRHESTRSHIELSMVKRIVRQKFLSWNAASAGQIEVIEYLEELIDLTKLLVGANEFRSGMLTRPTYRDYIERIGKQHSKIDDSVILEPEDERRARKMDEEMRDTVPDALRRRRAPTMAPGTVAAGTTALSKQTSNAEKKQAREDELPLSLQRVRSRRIEERNERLEQVRSQDGGRTRTMFKGSIKTSQ